MGVLAGGRMITRKHMNMMAEKVRSIEDAETKTMMIDSFIELCETNPRFDRSRFMQACGVMD